jgi:hypothetical protein
MASRRHGRMWKNYTLRLLILRNRLIRLLGVRSPPTSNQLQDRILRSFEAIVPHFINSQRLDNLASRRSAYISECLSVSVYDFKAAV